MKSKYLNLAGMVLQIDDNYESDIEFENSCHEAGISTKEIAIMDESAAKYINTFLKDGVPFPGDILEYDEIVKNDLGLQLIQKWHDACS